MFDALPFAAPADGAYRAELKSMQKREPLYAVATEPGRTDAARVIEIFLIALLPLLSASCGPKCIAARNGGCCQLQPLDNFARVSKDLYRSAQPCVSGFQLLHDIGIKSIVSLRTTQDDHDFFCNTDFVYCKIPTHYLHPNDRDCIVFLNFIREARKNGNAPVLIHCASGQDRTGLFVAVYRIVEEGWDVESAIAEMDRFHFNPWWINIKCYVRSYDQKKVDSIRQSLK